MKSGPAQLKDWMHRRKFLQKETAEFLGFDETFVSQLVNGRRQPGLVNAIVIERLTGIPVEAWLSTSVDESSAGAAAAVAKPQSDNT
jgi:transcriptional regulator with XRE-family HTH domain